MVILQLNAIIAANLVLPAMFLNCSLSTLLSQIFDSLMREYISCFQVKLISTIFVPYHENFAAFRTSSDADIAPSLKWTISTTSKNMVLPKKREDQSFIN